MTALSGASASLSSTSASATQVTYVAKFKSTNGLTLNRSTLTLTASAGTVFPTSGCAAATATQMTYTAKFKSPNGLTRNSSTVTLTAAPGTTFPTQGCACAIADPRLRQSGSCLAAIVSSGANAVIITTGINVGAGDPVVVTVDGVGNITTAGTRGLTISTTSDPRPRSTVFTLTTPTRETTVEPSLTSTAATASQVTYVVSYVAPNGLTWNYSQVRLIAPVGTVFPSGGCGVYVITDNTTATARLVWPQRFPPDRLESPS